MSALKTALLWVAALALVAFIVLRFRRGERVVLKGRWSPRLLRMIAILVVAYGWHPEAVQASPPPEACKTLEPAAPRPLPPKALDPRAPPITLTPDDSPRVWSSYGGLAIQAFRSARAAPPDDLATLTRELALAHRRARLAEAYKAAIAEGGYPEFRPWMGKSAPPPNYGVRVDPKFRALFEKHVASATAGTWDSEAVLDVTIASGGGTLIRAAVETPIPDGAALRFGRLDLLRAGDRPLVLRHPTLGELTVPAGRTVASWRVPELLTPQARDAVRALVQRAATCDATALRALEAILPAAHQALRDERAGSPAEAAEPKPGHPSLGILITLYEE